LSVATPDYAVFFVLKHEKMRVIRNAIFHANFQGTAFFMGIRTDLTDVTRSVILQNSGLPENTGFRFLQK